MEDRPVGLAAKKGSETNKNNKQDMSENKDHLSLVICGHVDAGKSTLTGRLQLELGNISERQMDALRKEAEHAGKASFALAFSSDTLPEERARGVSIRAKTSEFFTESKHFTSIDAPGHGDFIKNMVSGAAQADVALLLVPADGNFESAIARGDHKTGQVQGQTRQHALLTNLLGVKQLIVGINKMDAAKYSEERYNEIKNEVYNMLRRVGWKKEQLDSAVPFIPLSGFTGDNVTTAGANMDWYKGKTVSPAKGKSHVTTLLEALEALDVPERNDSGRLRLPVSQCFNKNGVVVCGRLEQGTVSVGDSVVFLPRLHDRAPLPLG
jgi:elongation factor 1-alpha